MMPIAKKYQRTWDSPGPISTWDVLNNHEFLIEDWHTLVKVSAESIVTHLGKGRSHWPWAESLVDAEATFVRLLTRVVHNDFPDDGVRRVQIADATTMYEVACLEALGVGAIIGLALGKTWPVEPAEFTGWLDRAITYAGLDIPESVPRLIAEGEVDL